MTEAAAPQPFDVSRESADFEAWYEKARQDADYINGSDKHRAWMVWFARATAGVKGKSHG